MAPPFSQVERLLLDQNATKAQIALYKKLYARFLETRNRTLDWSQVQSPEPDSILDYRSLDQPTSEKIQQLLSETAICRLNGGLGTSMGCVGPKSALEVREGLSFLDIIVEQIQHLNKTHQANIPLLLMNSFNTEVDTQKILSRFENKLEILSFKQNHIPRLRKDSLLPMSKNTHGIDAFYPPGHGDFYDSFYASGFLDKLLKQGKKYLFLANADNLGASLDFQILNYLDQSNSPFIMEVTKKTRADVKGGTLIKTSDSELQLLEIAQVPKDFIEEFKSVTKFKIFNTNNLWLNLEALKARMEEGDLGLDIIVNQKTVNQIPVIQLETAMGSAIKAFPGSKAIQVPRERFLPVKKTEDLLLVQSNLFTLQDGVLVRNPAREFDNLPMIRLGDKFKTIEDYNAHFANIPDILELDLLTIVGDIYFGKNIQLKGNVIVVCDQGKLHLPKGSILENQVLTGNIEIGEL